MTNEAKTETKTPRVTNLSRAIELVKAKSLPAQKQEVLAQMQKDFNVTKSNAFVYYTKAIKALGIVVEKQPKVKVVKEKKAQQKVAKAINENANALKALKEATKGAPNPFAPLIAIAKAKEAQKA